MKSNIISSAALVCGLLTTPMLWGASASTDPVGYKNITIKGESVTLLGVEFLSSPSFVGSINSVNGNIVEFTNIDLNNVLNSDKKYFIDVTSGLNEGVNTSILDWTASTITLLDDLDGLVAPSSDQVRIHELPTLSDVFGDILQPGTSDTADIIYMPDPSAGGLAAFYRSSGGFFGTGWRQIGKGSVDMSNMPIYFSDGLYVIKRSPGDVELTVSGHVKMSSTILAVEAGFTPLSTVFPAGTTLANSGLYDPQNLGDSIAAGNSSTADLVYMDSDGDGNLEVCYYSSGGFFGNGWRRVGLGSQDVSTLPMGSAFGILRRSNNPISLSRSKPY